MDKPISLLISDTKNAFVKVANESKLPPCILEMIIKELHTEVALLSQEQRLADIQKCVEAEQEEEKEDA